MFSLSSGLRFVTPSGLQFKKKKMCIKFHVGRDLEGRRVGEQRGERREEKEKREGKGREGGREAG